MDSDALNADSRRPEGFLMETKIPQELQDAYQLADKNMWEFINRNYPKGKFLRWKTGDEKGKICRVIQCCSIREPMGDYTIGVIVSTQKKDGWKKPENFYADPDHFFEEYELAIID